MFKVSRIKDGRHRSNVSLLKEFYDIIEPSYQVCRELLEKEVNFCDKCYLLHQEEQLVGFFMTGTYIVTSEEKSYLSVYLGLSAIAKQLKGSVAIRKLYESCLEDLKQPVVGRFDDGFLWGTTANPLIFLAVSRFLSEVQPSLDGTFTERSESILKVIKNAFFSLTWSEKTSPMHPFVLYGVTSARYSEEEKKRQKGVARRFSLFEELGINEVNGDRMVFIVQHPGVKNTSKCMKTDKVIEVNRS